MTLYATVDLLTDQTLAEFGDDDDWRRKLIGTDASATWEMPMAEMRMAEMIAHVDFGGSLRLIPSRVFEGACATCDGRLDLTVREGWGRCFRCRCYWRCRSFEATPA